MLLVREVSGCDLGVALQLTRRASSESEAYFSSSSYPERLHQREKSNDELSPLSRRPPSIASMQHIHTARAHTRTRMHAHTYTRTPTEEMLFSCFSCFSPWDGNVPLPARPCRVASGQGVETFCHHNGGSTAGTVAVEQVQPRHASHWRRQGPFMVEERGRERETETGPLFRMSQKQFGDIASMTTPKLAVQINGTYSAFFCA